MERELTKNETVLALLRKMTATPGGNRELRAKDYYEALEKAMEGEDTRLEKESILLSALMLELKGNSDIYEHYRTQLNEIRGFKNDGTPL